MYIKTYRYQQLDSIEIKETLFKEFELPNHFHETYCIGLLSNGIKKSVIEETPQLIHSNSVSIINPYQIHSDKTIDKEDCLYKMIYLNKDVLNYFTKKTIGKNSENLQFTNELITNSTVIEGILAFFNDLNNENLLENKLKNLIESLLIWGFLKDVCIIHKENKNAIDDSISKVRLNFADKIDIQKMSNESKMSKFQFIRFFKKKTGLTPASYILLHRIIIAKSMLEKGFPIGEIALDVGFYDHAQFCKFFKYYTNISPTEYKRNCNIIQA